MTTKSKLLSAVPNTLDQSGSYTTLTVTGNVGIGQPSPAYKLDVQGAGTVARFYASSTSYSAINISDNTSGSGVTLISNGNDLAIQLNGAEKLRINSAGVATIPGTLSTAAYTETIVALGTVGAAATLAITAGTFITATLTSATACTFTMPTVAAGKSFILYLRQPAAGTATTATFTNVKWGSAGAPTITATVGKMDILSFSSDGTAWYGAAAQGYTY